MADNGWNSVTSRRDRKSQRDDELREDRLRAEAPRRSHRTQDLAWFDSTHPPPDSTEEEYDHNHAQLYGTEERMINGRHRRGQPSFPDGSERAVAYAAYDVSTVRRNRASADYTAAHGRHDAEIRERPLEEKTYYKHSTKGLLPTQHAHLSPFALDWGDAARE